MMEFLGTMGPFLVPLLAVSVYSWGLMAQQQGRWRRAQPLGAAQLSQVLDDLAAGREPSGLGAGHPLAEVISRRTEGPGLLRARAQASLAPFEASLGLLPALANLATLGGLFGTVCGMIGAFLSLRAGGGADPSALAGGLGQALSATALGLLTAIPCLGGHALFQRRLVALTSQLETVLSALTDREEPRG